MFVIFDVLMILRSEKNQHSGHEIVTQQAVVLWLFIIDSSKTTRYLQISTLYLWTTEYASDLFKAQND